MCWSDCIHVPRVMRMVRKHKPMSVLDVGIGFGKWGYLFREALDASNGHPLPDQWESQIDGVEIFEDYIGKPQKAVYDKIYIGDICELVETMGDYDMIFSADVIEHIEKLQALWLIGEMLKKCKWLLLLVPIGPTWYGPERFLNGNINEAHLSIWNDNEFDSIESHVENLGDNPHGYYLLQGGSDGSV